LSFCGAVAEYELENPHLQFILVIGAPREELSSLQHPHLDLSILYF
jgi:hypothetical protein